MMATTGVIDAVLTWMSLEHFGTVGELNPAILQFHRMGLLPLWSLITIVSSLLGGSILVSACLMFEGSTRNVAATAFGLLLGIRVATIAVSMGNCFKIPFLASAGMLTGVGIFLFSTKYLTDGVSVTIDGILWNIKDFAFTLMDMGTRLSQVVLPQPRMSSSSNFATDVLQKRTRRPARRKILTPVFLIAVALIALVGVLEFLRGHVFQSVPWWLRELGIVEQMQGQAFLVVFISILLTLAVLTYCVLSIAEALSGSQDQV